MSLSHSSGSHLAASAPETARNWFGWEGLPHRLESWACWGDESRSSGESCCSLREEAGGGWVDLPAPCCVQGWAKSPFLEEADVALTTGPEEKLSFVCHGA